MRWTPWRTMLGRAVCALLTDGAHRELRWTAMTPHGVYSARWARCARCGEWLR